MDRSETRNVPFTKMEGLGNDYLYIDRFVYKVDRDWSALAREMAERHFGAGSDGIILIEPGASHCFRMRMFNADGSEGEMCGNGMRCFARYVYDHGLTRETEFPVETGFGIVTPRLNLDAEGGVESVSVDMGIPVFRRRDIPLSRLEGPEPAIGELVEVDGQVLRGTALSTGNPHCVFFVEDVSKVELERIGPKLERHPLFPMRANIEFVSVKSGTEMDMRVWERGSGITLACGTGASASTVAAVLNGYAERDVPVRVNLAGGPLTVEWKSDGHVRQTGPAREVYTGVFFHEAR
jgi:diaminopimelate epimerase